MSRDDSIVGDLEAISQAAVEAQGYAEQPVDAASRGESPSLNYSYAPIAVPITVGICAMNKKVHMLNCRPLFAIGRY